MSWIDIVYKKIQSTMVLNIDDSTHIQQSRTCIHIFANETFLGLCEGKLGGRVNL
jgi:hypothetical protein